MKNGNSSPKRHILYVDGNVEARENFINAFSDDYKVTTVRNGMEALKWIEKDRRNRPDAIVSEVDLPGISGNQLMGAIEARTGLSNTPFMFLTNSVPHYVLEATEDGGLVDVFSKSEGFEALSHMITDVTSSKKNYSFEWNNKNILTTLPFMKKAVQRVAI